MTWANQYIGQPWIAGEHDCWAFARRVWREQYGWDVPAVDVDALSRLDSARAMQAPSMYADWQGTAAPGEGDAVLMGRSSRAAHVGVWTGEAGGGIVHNVQGIGVIFTPPERLQDMGLRVLQYYRRAGH